MSKFFKALEQAERDRLRQEADPHGPTASETFVRAEAPAPAPAAVAVAPAVPPPPIAPPRVPRTAVAPPGPRARSRQRRSVTRMAPPESRCSSTSIS